MDAEIQECILTCSQGKHWRGYMDVKNNVSTTLCLLGGEHSCVFSWERLLRWGAPDENTSSTESLLANLNIAIRQTVVTMSARPAPY